MCAIFLRFFQLCLISSHTSIVRITDDQVNHFWMANLKKKSKISAPYVNPPSRPALCNCSALVWRAWNSTRLLKALLHSILIEWMASQSAIGPLHQSHTFNPREWAKSSQVHLLCKECIVHRKLWFVLTGKTSSFNYTVLTLPDTSVGLLVTAAPSITIAAWSALCNCSAWVWRA